MEWLAPIVLIVFSFIFLLGVLIIIFPTYAPHRERPVSKRPADDTWEPMFGNPVSEWLRVFAWRPVHTLDHGYIWLRFYWRRRIYKKQFLHGGPNFWWQNAVSLGYHGH